MSEENTTPAEANEAAAAAAPEHWAKDSEHYEGVKQYATPIDLAKAHVEIQKMSSGMVKIPEEGDVEGLAKMHARLGRPESADKYEIAATEGVTQNDEYLTAMKQGGFDLGLSQAQMAGLAKISDGFVGTSNAAQAEANETLNNARAERLGWDDTKKTELTEEVRRKIVDFSEKNPVPEGETSFADLMLDEGKFTRNDPWLVAFADFCMDNPKDDKGIVKGDPAGSTDDGYKPPHGPETYWHGTDPDSLKARAYHEKHGYDFEAKQYVR